ncbi:MAG: GIY-YIG nuclease family protein [Bacteroidota bacterium]
MKFYVYIIYSPSKNRYYIGQTDNLNRRLEDHRNSRSGFTKGIKDWELKWSYEVSDRSEAMTLESKIKKKKSRRYLEYLIGGGSVA